MKKRFENIKNAQVLNANSHSKIKGGGWGNGRGLEGKKNCPPPFDPYGDM